MHRVTWDVDAIEKGGYEHFMLKEIFEQPSSLRDVMRGRLLEEEGDARLGGIAMHQATCSRTCGASSSRRAARAGMPAWSANTCSRSWRESPWTWSTRRSSATGTRCWRTGPCLLAISQSGETADTLAALREGKQRGVPVMGIVNTVGSSIARATDFGMYLHAGPEIGVASTKAFTSQIVALALFTLRMGRRRSLSVIQGREIVNALQHLPEQVEQVLALNDEIRELAASFKDESNFLYLGRGFQFPVALEGALKLKEVSYIHAEGYPAAEMKHGPIALIDDNMPVVFLAPQDAVYGKVVSNIEEVKARGGRILAVVSDGAAELIDKVDHVIRVPQTIPSLLPVLTTIPLQLLAYHVAVLRGADVDQPRNLAKSVTVE